MGKATIYRRWPGKEDMLLDALALLATPLPEPQGRSVRDDLVALLDAMCEEAADPRRPGSSRCCRARAAVPAADGQVPGDGDRAAPRAVRTVLRRGVATGELREDTDVDAVMYLLSGAALARGGPGEPSDSRYAGEWWTSC